MNIQQKILMVLVAAWSWGFSSIPGTVHAAVTMVDGTPFSNTVTVHQNRLDLQGAALLRYMYFIEAYTGALYLPDTADGSHALEDIPKHLVLEYRVAISAEDFARATEKKSENRSVMRNSSDSCPKLRPLTGYTGMWHPKTGTP